LCFPIISDQSHPNPKNHETSTHHHHQPPALGSLSAGALALLHPPPAGLSKWPGLLLALCLACESRDQQLLKQVDDRSLEDFPNLSSIW